MPSAQIGKKGAPSAYFNKFNELTENQIPQKAYFFSK
jgi:hypothetical protein